MRLGPQARTTSHGPSQNEPPRTCAQGLNPPRWKPRVGMRQIQRPQPRCPLGCEISLAQRTTCNPNVGFGDLHTQILQLGSAQPVPGHPLRGQRLQEEISSAQMSAMGVFPLLPSSQTSLLIKTGGTERLGRPAGEAALGPTRGFVKVFQEASAAL